MTQSFDDTTIRNISDILAGMLTHTKISEQFSIYGIEKSNKGTNKSDVIFYALLERQKKDKCGNNVLGFVLKLINPKRYDSETDFERDRAHINEKLIYEGIEISKEGKAKIVDKAKTISEAKERSLKIKEKTNGLIIHQEILPFCEKEWLQENYFHSILEITKSVSERIRKISGTKKDGSELIDFCFGLGKNKKPMLAFNLLKTESEESEHKGFTNFCKGFFGMFRNPKAHNPRILEETQLYQMTESLVIATIIHRKLDNTFKTGYK